LAENSAAEHGIEADYAPEGGQEQIALKTVPEWRRESLSIIALAVWSLMPRAHLHLRNDRLAGFFGFAAGRPPLAMYGSLRQWPPANFRATLQGYFLPASLAGMAGYCTSGGLDHELKAQWSALSWIRSPLCCASGQHRSFVVLTMIKFQTTGLERKQ
jgi:hypothetical protein